MQRASFDAGGDFIVRTASSACNCSAQCAATPLCVAWQFDTTTSSVIRQPHASSHQCKVCPKVVHNSRSNCKNFLHRLQRSPPHLFRDWIDPSAALCDACAAVPGVTRPGSDLQVLTIAPSPCLCAAICDRETSCVAWDMTAINATAGVRLKPFLPLPGRDAPSNPPSRQPRPCDPSGPTQASNVPLLCPAFDSTALCGPGSFSATGTPPCSNCPINTFGPSCGATACVACPSGATSAVGSVGAANCTLTLASRLAAAPHLSTAAIAAWGARVQGFSRAGPDIFPPFPIAGAVVPAAVCAMACAQQILCGGWVFENRTQLVLYFCLDMTLKCSLKGYWASMDPLPAPGFETSLKSKCVTALCLTAQPSPSPSLAHHPPTQTSAASISAHGPSTPLARATAPHCARRSRFAPLGLSKPQRRFVF